MPYSPPNLHFSSHNPRHAPLEMQFLNIPLSTLLLVATALSSPSHPTITTGKSDITKWTCTLSSQVPTISTKLQLLDLGNAYNGTIRVDRVAGVNMVIEHQSSTQVAAIAPGELHDMVESVIPGLKVQPEVLAEQSKAADDMIAAMANGTFTYTPFNLDDFGSKGTVGGDKHHFFDTAKSDTGAIEPSKLVTDSKIAGKHHPFLS
ncbi:hypothetical protein LTR62_000574 [Meristemomyces frigidus]|uniref:Uncharacterized protein n=1 Tax=Meristemomyces frigidus TaxID=1508187 RepID=A0AAN7YC84_9PEZI|nr:hypothetical protein LTR62_000574 [Meristemomyces frigidus]